MHGKQPATVATVLAVVVLTGRAGNDNDTSRVAVGLLHAATAAANRGEITPGLAVSKAVQELARADAQAALAP